MNEPRGQTRLVVLSDGSAFISGGGFGSDISSSAEAYNPATGVWSVRASMPAATVGHTYTLLRDGDVLVAGGGSDAFDTAVSNAEIFDPGSDSWTSTAPLNRARVFQTATLLPDGHVLVAGGGGAPAGAVNINSSAEIFTPVPQHPTSKNQCKKGGWKTFTNPKFKNQGQCIRFVKTGK